MSHPNTWREDLENLNIKVKENEHFYIFNYAVGCDFHNELVKASRGLILDKSDFSVACWKFDKFANAHEDYVDPIDWSTARVLEKIDGSILGLYWNKYENNWNWSTNGTINAREAPCDSLFSKNFHEIIQKADNLKDIDFDNLNKDWTYIFELVGPENKVVVNYPKTQLYHIGTRDNLTGLEMEVDIGIQKPKTYPLHTFDDCLKAVKELNADIDMKANGSSELKEGFVVVDGNYHRCKVKAIEYLNLHHFANGVIYNKDKIISLLKTDDFNLNEIVQNYPDYKEVFDYYKDEMERVEKEAQNLIDYARATFKSNGGSKKDLAAAILESPYSNLGFKSIGNEKTAKTLLSELNDVQYNKLIKDFREREIEPERGGGLF